MLLLRSVGVFIRSDQCRAIAMTIAIATHGHTMRIIDITIAVLLIRLSKALLEHADNDH